MKMFTESLIDIEKEKPNSVYAYYLYLKFSEYINKDFKDWVAYKYGLIDKDGKVIKEPTTQIEIAALNAVANLARKIKRISKKHGNDSVIKILAYYLRNQSRSQSLAFSEKREFVFTKNFLKYGRLLIKEATSLTDELVIDFNGDLTTLINEDSLKLLTKNLSVTVNDDMIKNMIIEDFYDGGKAEIKKYGRFVIKSSDWKYKIFNFPTEINILSDAGDFITKISINNVKHDYLHATNSNKDDIQGESFVKFIQNANNLDDLIKDISDVILADVRENSFNLYYTGAKASKLIVAILKDGKLKINTLDETMTKNFVDILGDSTEISEDTTTASLSGYIPAIGKKPKKKIKESLENIDDKYLKAVENNEKDELQNMVDIAAKNAGYNVGPVYHGTGAIFSSFQHKEIGAQATAYGHGFYFTDDIGLAKSYVKESGRLLKGYLKMTKVLSLKKKTMTVNDIKKLIKEVDPTGDNLIANFAINTNDYGSSSFYKRELITTANKLYKNNDNDADILADMANSGAGKEEVLLAAHRLLGYDGFITKEDETNIYVVFKSSQFKLSDFVLYDDNGNIVPLSKRFNTNSDDIREASKATVLQVIKNNISMFLDSAQALYDDWKMSTGKDRDVHKYGICSDIAESFADILIDIGLKAMVINNDEEKHTYAVAYSDGSEVAYRVDIPFEKYEKRIERPFLHYDKIPNIKFTYNDIKILKTKEIYENIKMASYLEQCDNFFYNNSI